jgi:toxin ParE1/3/4
LFHAVIAHELREPSTAKKLVASFRELISGLEQMPAGHPIVRDEKLAGQGVRKIVVDDYISPV